MEVEVIRARLIENVDDKYREFSKRLTPDDIPIIGVRTPVIKELAKKIARDNPADFLQNFNPENHEEILLRGFVIAIMKIKYCDKRIYVLKHVDVLSNWAQVDTFACAMKTLDDFDDICEMLGSDKPFVCRYAIIRMLASYINQEYVDRVLALMETVKHQNYYVKMGIAWLYSLAFIKFKDKTASYIARADDEIKKMAKQKIRDSRRVEKTDKENLQTM